MSRPKDCIYCSNATGSGEHIFPAALGGRRKNYGILCSACNEGFSDLDVHLAGQLQYIRGVVGVRPDHKDLPVPASVLHRGETLLIDAQGRPSYRNPILRSEEMLQNGNRRVQIEFSDERQAAAWLSKQKREGLVLTDTRQTRVSRVMTDPVEIAWEFGGPKTFREAARIALNFLAHKFPLAVRAQGLRPLKDYVQSERILTLGERRPVWFLNREVVIPPSTVELGHQVFLRLDREQGRGYAILRFFDVAELVVDFGAIEPEETIALLFDIDPHVHRQPDDIRERTLAPEDFPAVIDLTKVGEEGDARLGNYEHLARIFSTISARQSRMRIAPLTIELERIRSTPPMDWHESIHAALDEHEGSIYRLIEYVSEAFAAEFPQQADLEPYRVALAALSEPDLADPSGLTTETRMAVRLARTSLATTIADELAAGEISLDRLVLLLEGTPGAHAVAQALLTFIGQALDSVADATSPPPQ